MRVHHELHRISNQVPAGQRIQHAVVPHGDAIINRNRVEFLGHATGLLDLASHQLAHVLQMHVTRHKLRKRVGDGNDRLLEITIFHACGTPQ